MFFSEIICTTNKEDLKHVRPRKLSYAPVETENVN